jgi:hypothetical protein
VSTYGLDYLFYSLAGQVEIRVKCGLLSSTLILLSLLLSFVDEKLDQEWPELSSACGPDLWAIQLVG